MRSFRKDSYDRVSTGESHKRHGCGADGASMRFPSRANRFKTALDKDVQYFAYDGPVVFLGYIRSGYGVASAHLEQT